MMRLGPLYDCMFFAGAGVRFRVELFLRGRLREIPEGHVPDGRVQIGDAVGPSAWLCVFFSGVGVRFWAELFHWVGSDYGEWSF